MRRRVKVSFTLSEPMLKKLNFACETLEEKKSHIIERALDFYFSCIIDDIFSLDKLD